MSLAESRFFAWMKRERKALQIAHVRKVEASGGSCDGLRCVRCPIDCSVVESDAITLHKASEWLKANAS